VSGSIFDPVAERRLSLIRMLNRRCGDWRWGYILVPALMVFEN